MKVSLQYIKTKKIKVIAFTVFKLQNLKDKGLIYVEKMVIYHRYFKW